MFKPRLRFLMNSEPFFPMLEPSRREEILRLEIQQLEKKVDDAAARLDDLRKLHTHAKNDTWNTTGICSECDQIWPCDAIKILNRKNDDS